MGTARWRQEWPGRDMALYEVREKLSLQERFLPYVRRSHDGRGRGDGDGEDGGIERCDRLMRMQ